MPDDPSFEPTPADWGRAFAALPPEAPDTDAWPRLARALRDRRRARWPLWLAAAAVLALAAVLPWRLSSDAGPAPDAATPIAGQDAPVSPDSAPAGDGAAPGEARIAIAPSTRQRADAGASVPPPATPSASRVAPSDPADSDSGARSASAPIAPSTDEPSPPAPTDAQPRIASDAGVPGTPANDTSPELEDLYAESAQLEALVAMARDDHVATTGTAAALASQYESQVAAIDARLIELGATQPDLTRAERTRLWRERVDAMRELAGFESTQRLLAARGERYDAMLVSID